MFFAGEILQKSGADFVCCQHGVRLEVLKRVGARRDAKSDTAGLRALTEPVMVEYLP